MKKVVLSLVVLAGLGLVLVFPLATPAVQDAKSLDGNWSGIRWLSGGANPADEDGTKLSLTFQKGKIGGKYGSGKVIAEGTYKVSADGKGFDATGTTGSYTGQNYLAIFKIQGDDMTVCIKKDTRPGAYIAGKEGGILMKLKRQK